MPLDTDQRATFLAMLADLEPGADAQAVTRWGHAHAELLHDELAARPGFDQVRAGLIRLAPMLFSGQVLTQALDAAAEAVVSFQADIAEGDPTLMLARHPAWVGLAAIELAIARGQRLESALDLAISLSTTGFAKIGGKVSAGDALWAMAEQAEESGWLGRSRALLAAALDQPFTDEGQAIQAKLVLGLQLAEAGDPDAIPLLEAVASLGTPGDRHRTHARWVLAALARHHGEVARAQGLLADALAEIDAEDEPEIAAKLAEALNAVGDA